MKKQALKMTVERSSDAFWAYAEVKGGVISTNGDNLEELKQHVVEAVNLFFEDKGISYTLNEIQFVFDIESFFEYYGIINAKALAARIGMSQSLLAQYAKGIKKPSEKQVKRIMTGVRSLGKELASIELA
jgi:hypothetical protein